MILTQTDTETLCRRRFVKRLYGQTGERRTVETFEKTSERSSTPAARHVVDSDIAHMVEETHTAQLAPPAGHP